jgi:hypothetical protein
MKNPMWFAEEKFEKVKKGERALEQTLARSAQTLGTNVGLDATFAAEIVRQMIHRVLLLAVELGLLSLIRQLMGARPPARVYPLIAPKS